MDVLAILKVVAVETCGRELAKHVDVLAILEVVALETCDRELVKHVDVLAIVNVGAIEALDKNNKEARCASYGSHRPSYCLR